MKKLTILVLSMAILISFPSCKKYLETGGPINQVSSNEVFLTESSAVSAVSALYSRITANNGYLESSFVGAITFLPAMSADEVYDVYPFYDSFKDNNLTVSDGNNNNLWGSGYGEIYAINAAIEGLTAAPLSTPVKNQLLGECYTLRAFCYFYLTNLYGDVPLILTTALADNRSKGRNAQAEVYAQVTQDLLVAQANLSDSYPNGSTLKVRINRAAATALLARVYLYQKNYPAAEQQSSTIISNTNFSLSSLENTFKNTSAETILQLFTFYGYNQFGNNTIPNGPTPEYVTYANLEDSFEPGDRRKEHWLGSGQNSGSTVYYPAKYKLNASTTNGDEYTVVFRLAEQYLIRAEARAYQGKINGTESATADVNVIRTRAGLSPLVLNDISEATLAIENERYHELFFEFGHRWLDLKRTGRASTILSPQKPSWSPKSILYPIPSQQIALVPALTQNTGY